MLLCDYIQSSRFMGTVLLLFAETYNIEVTDIIKSDGFITLTQI